MVLCCRCFPRFLPLRRDDTHIQARKAHFMVPHNQIVKGSFEAGQRKDVWQRRRSRSDFRGTSALCLRSAFSCSSLLRCAFAASVCNTQSHHTMRARIAHMTIARIQIQSWLASTPNDLDRVGRSHTQCFAAVVALRSTPPFCARPCGVCLCVCACCCDSNKARGA